MSIPAGSPAPPASTESSPIDRKAIGVVVVATFLLALGVSAIAHWYPDTLTCLLTNNRVTGWVAWISLYVTVGGFAVAWWQLFKVAGAAVAAKNAVSETAKLVRGQEQSNRINTAVSYLRDADKHVANNNDGAAIAYLHIGWLTLIDAKNLTKSDADRDQLGEHVRDAKRVLDEINGAVAPPLGLGVVPVQSSQNRRAIIARILGELEEMSARLRYTLTGLGV